MINFFIGLFVGTTLGVIIMSVLVVSRRDQDELNHYVEIEQLRHEIEALKEGRR